MAKKTSIRIDSPYTLRYFRGNIILQYSYNGGKGIVRYILHKVPEGAFLEKSSSLKTSDEYDAEKIVEKIHQKLYDVNLAIKHIEENPQIYNGKITVNDIDTFIAQNIKKQITTEKGLIKDFEEWIDEFNKKKLRETTLAGKECKSKIHPTTKDYISTLHLLQDFEHDNYDCECIQFKDIDPIFLELLIKYAWDERPEEDPNDNYKYKTQGDLANKTINKRFDCLFTFLKSFYKCYPNDITKPKLETNQRRIIRLERHELKQLEELPLEGREEKIRDYFVFLCLTGLRFGDFIKLNRTFYNPDTNEITLKASKTSAECRIFLFDKAKVIAEKYDFKFDHFQNQVFNRDIKKLLTKYDLFPEPITMTITQEKRKTYTARKRDLITCHVGRRTYISTMLELGLDVYDVMSATGHRQINTLKYYIDLFGESRRNKFLRINEKINKEI